MCSAWVLRSTFVDWFGDEAECESDSDDIPFGDVDAVEEEVAGEQVAYSDEIEGIAAEATIPSHVPWPSSWCSLVERIRKLEAPIFLEIFAGDATLSRAVKGRGVPTLLPDEVRHGGTTFLLKKEIEQLLDNCRGLLEYGRQLMLHLAPPCSSFSRARDRSAKTKLISSARTCGDETCPVTTEGNTLACNAYRFAPMGGP